MIQREKRYVEVDVRFSTEGRLRPLQIIFDKGQVYKIDKIKDICRRAADVGGVGDRYTCMIQGKERELWFEDGRWFVAAKVINEKHIKKIILPAINLLSQFFQMINVIQRFQCFYNLMVRFILLQFAAANCNGNRIYA